MVESIKPTPIPSSKHVLKKQTPTRVVNKAPVYNNPATVMTVQQASDHLGLAVSTLNKWRCQGGGPAFIKMGRAVRYRVEDLENYISESRLVSTSIKSETR